MRVEWLNDELTRARVIKGWFRKVQAEVVLHMSGGYWRFVANNEHVPGWIDRRLDREQRRERVRRLDRVWQPVEQMPMARLVERTP